jgi:hypothetical protein
MRHKHCLLRTHHVRRPLLLLLVCLLAPLLRADCIGYGHYTIDSAPFPYTEDLVHHADDLPVGDPVTVRYREDLAWTKIQGGCTMLDERNVRASVAVNVLLRASFRVAWYPSPSAPAGTRFEVQLRLGEAVDDPNARVVASAVRTLGPRQPQSERLGGIVRDLPAGNYVYSMWMRILDGPASNDITFGLQWITAQGTPSTMPAAEATSFREQVIDDHWTAVGRELTIDAKEAGDLSLLTSYEATGSSALLLAWSLDDRGPEPRIVVTAAQSATIFDHLAGVAPGRHTLRLLARTADGSMTLRKIHNAVVVFSRDAVQPMSEASASQPVIATQAGSDVQPYAMSSVCGRWTKLLDLVLEPADGASPSWVLEGFVEIVGWTGEGTYAQVGIDAAHLENGKDAVTDMGMVELQLSSQHDGISFYGDCSKWGNAGEGTRLSLWIRRIEGCLGEPSGGAITVGQRWLSVKLLPSPTPHLPADRRRPSKP